MQHMMESLTDPDAMELTARYENARISVSEGYRHAANILRGTKITKDEYFLMAREIAHEMERDLNSKIEIAKGNDKGKPA